MSVGPEAEGSGWGQARYFSQPPFPCRQHRGHDKASAAGGVGFQGIPVSVSALGPLGPTCQRSGLRAGGPPNTCSRMHVLSLWTRVEGRGGGHRPVYNSAESPRGASRHLPQRRLQGSRSALSQKMICSAESTSGHVPQSRLAQGRAQSARQPGLCPLPYPALSPSLAWVGFLPPDSKQEAPPVLLSSVGPRGVLRVKLCPHPKFTC